MEKQHKKLSLTTWIFCLPIFLHAQGLTLPPSGDNQKSVVSQYMGIVESRFTYNSPDVTGPGGEDRKGKIWGQLVPWGMTNLGFGTAKESPWRAGANENTVFTVSHDVLISGKTLNAGIYGFHIIPNETGPWTLIFSKNSSSWGSFYYDPSEDALRVEVAPVACEYNEWLTFGFEDRHLASCTAFLKWENMKVPFKIEVPDINRVYLEKIRDDLRSSIGFSWTNWAGAAQFCVNRKINLEEALLWADNAISLPFIGQENFTTLQTKSQVLFALGKEAEAKELMVKAVHHPTASVNDIHQYGRALLNSGKNQEAMEVFKVNREINSGDTFTTYVGLARGYAAIGDKKNAVKNWEIAIKNIPEEQKVNLTFYQSELEKVKEL
ncbi:MAG TPA: DUF2911 domain-containing protein [Cyclobacteriaceae bacterium]|nr:DUF2911 domain-containing protein [Cyclobacteriaceae bacterium]